MSEFIRSVNDKIVLNCTIKNLDGDLVAQPVDFPKVQIFRTEAAQTVQILAPTVMNFHADGEYYYEWQIPGTPGMYKARYIGEIDGEEYRGYDYILAEVPKDKYNSWGT